MPLFTEDQIKHALDTVRKQDEGERGDDESYNRLILPLVLMATEWRMREANRGATMADMHLATLRAAGWMISFTLSQYTGNDPDMSQSDRQQLIVESSTFAIKMARHFYEQAHDGTAPIIRATDA